MLTNSKALQKKKPLSTLAANIKQFFTENPSPHDEVMNEIYKHIETNKESNTKNFWLSLIDLCQGLCKRHYPGSPWKNIQSPSLWLCRAIAEVKLNRDQWKDIERLEELIIAQQKRDAIRYYINEERAKLNNEEREKAYSESRERKLNAYSCLKSIILSSQKDVTLNDILWKDSQYLNSKIKRVRQYEDRKVDIDGLLYNESIKDGLREKRGRFSKRGISQATSQTKLDSLRNKLFRADPRTLLLTKTSSERPAPTALINTEESIINDQGVFNLALTQSLKKASITNVYLATLDNTSKRFKAIKSHLEGQGFRVYAALANQSLEAQINDLPVDIHSVVVVDNRPSAINYLNDLKIPGKTIAAIPVLQKLSLRLHGKNSSLPLNENQVPDNEIQVYYQSQESKDFLIVYYRENGKFFQKIVQLNTENPSEALAKYTAALEKIPVGKNRLISPYKADKEKNDSENREKPNNTLYNNMFVLLVNENNIQLTISDKQNNDFDADLQTVIENKYFSYISGTFEADYLLLCCLFQLKQTYAQLSQSRYHVNHIDELIHQTKLLLEKSNDHQNNAILIYRKIEEAFAREEQRFRNPFPALFGREKSKEEFMTMLTDEYAQTHHYPRLLKRILDNHRNLGGRATHPLHRHSENTSDHTQQFIKTEFSVGDQTYEIKGLTWNLLDMMVSKATNKNFKNNPWDAYENFSQFIERKQKQLGQIISLIQESKIDFAFLQEIDVLWFDVYTPREWTLEERIELEALRTEFCDSLKNLGWNLILPKDDGKIHQHGMAILYNTNIFQSSTMDHHGKGIIQSNNDWRGLSCSLIHIPSKQQVNLSNLHLNFQDKDEFLKNQLMALENDCFKNNELLIAGGDTNHPLDAFQGTVDVSDHHLGIVGDSNRVTNLRGDDNIGYLKRSDENRLEGINKRYKSYDLFNVKGTPTCHVKNITVSGQEFRKNGKGNYSIVPAKDLELVASCLMVGKPYMTHDEVRLTLTQELKNCIARVKSKSIIGCLSSLFCRSPKMEQEKQALQAAVKLLDGLSRRHQWKQLDEQELTALLVDTHLGPIYTKIRSYSFLDQEISKHISRQIENQNTERSEKFLTIN